jgi:O-antigen/teichoic acid export membrane protein
VTKTLKSRFVKGLGGQAVTQAVAVLIQLSTVPLLLHFWGLELMGEWLVLTAIPAYLMLSDLGFVSATINEMTMEVARDDRGAALRTFQSSGVMLGLMSAAMAVVAGLFAWAAPIGDWFGFVHLTNAEASAVIALQVAMVIGGIQMGLLNAGFVCEGAYGLGTAIMSAISLANFGLVIVAAATGLGPVGAAAFLIAGELVGLVVMRSVLRRVAPWLRLGLGHARRRRVRELLKPALGFVVYSVGQALNIQGVLLTVGAVLGPAAVTTFNTTRMMTRFVNILLTAYYSTVRPEISIAYGRGDMDLIRRLHAMACQVAVWLAIGAAVGFALLGGWFLRIWTHGEVTLDPWLLAGLIVAMLFYALWFASSMVFYGTSRHHGLAWTLVLANGMSVALAYALLDLVGLPGAGIAAAAAELVLMVFVVWRTLRMLDEPFLGWLMRVLPPPVKLVRQLIGRAS